jgi:hypothetical protein
VHEVGNKTECNNMHGERIKIMTTDVEPEPTESIQNLFLFVTHFTII